MKKFIYLISIVLGGVYAESQCFASSSILYSNQLNQPKQLSLVNAQSQLNGITPLSILKLYQPNLYQSGCEVILLDQKRRFDRTSQYYGVVCYGLFVDKMEIVLHQDRRQTLMLQFSYSDELLSFDEVVENPKLIKLSKGYNTIKTENRWCKKDKKLTLCQLQWKKTGSHLVKEAFSTLSGEVLYLESLSPHLAQVYLEGPHEEKTELIELSHLKKNGYLESNEFKVRPMHGTPVFSEDNQFLFSPDHSAKSFDQAQSYYGAHKILSWFEEKFSYQLNEQIIVTTNGEVNGNSNNAVYLPGVSGQAEIILGSGDGNNMRFISRDTDVIAHEFTHHVVFSRLKTVEKEAGIIHEAYADYFAYALNGDPYLGESIVIGKNWLRTANLESDVRYDDLSLGWLRHQKGQILSAVFWELRELYGSVIDEIVYHSIDFFSAQQSGFKHVFLGLLHSVDEVPLLEKYDLTDDDRSLLKCDILTIAVNRGFALYLEGFDDGACGVNLEDEIAFSRELREKTKAEEDKNDDNKQVGKLDIHCAVIYGRHNNIGITILLMIIPLLIPHILRKKVDV